MALDTNLVSYWKLDESSGDAADSVGSNNGVNTSVTYSTGKINNGGVFNGSAYLAIANDASLNPSYITISAWIKVSTTGVYQAICSKDAVSGGRVWQFRISNTNKLEFIPFNASTNVVVTGATTITDNLWRHVTGTYDGTTTKIYVNGILDASSGSLTGVLRSGQTNDVYIGADYTGSPSPVANYLTGSIDEVGIWSRALTADEVSQLYNSNRALAYPLTAPTLYGGVAYYKLDESSGDASDSIGTNTLTNANVTYGTGKINNGAVFNGTTDSLSTTTITNVNFTGATPFSFSTWSNQTTLANDGYLISHIKATANNEGYVLQIDNTGKVLFYIGDNNTGSSLLYLTTPTSSITTGAWYNVVVTYDGTKTPSGTKIYINGTSQTLTTVFNNFTGSSAWSGPFHVGSRESNSINFAGTIDEVAIFNRALTSTEVTELYNSGNGVQYPWATLIYTLICDAGSFALTGIDVALRQGFNLICSAGSFILTGVNVLLKKGGWTNQAKNTSTWTNGTKNTSSWTNGTKNSSTWTNQSKN
jgi:hypothetical protein